MNCIEHKDRELTPITTPFGTAYKCPVPKCTVMWWAGPTSTPANRDTRLARKNVHSVLDPLWKSGIIPRATIYEWLGRKMGLTKETCHVGMMDYDQAHLAYTFIVNLREYLLSQIKKEIKCLTP